MLQSEQALAQGQGASRPFVGVRGGLNLIGNTYRFRETRPVFGGGVSAGAFLSPTWAAEFETWVRTSNPECCERGRETLFSLSVVRLYARNGIQPYALGGLTWLRSHDNQLQVQVGLGVQAPIVDRLAFALDVRGNGGGSTMIVRPTAGVIYYLR